MTVYLKITSNKELVQGDYTDNTTYDLNATIYSDPEMQNTIDLTTFTLTVKLFEPNFNEQALYSSTTGVTGTSAGVLSWRPTISSAPDVFGWVKLRVILEDSTQRLTSIGVSGSDDIFIKRR